MFIRVHLCSSVFICDHLCSIMFICVHLSSFVFVCVHLRLSFFLCFLPLFARAPFIHVLMWTCVHMCLNVSIRVHVCVHLFRNHFNSRRAPPCCKCAAPGASRSQRGACGAGPTFSAARARLERCLRRSTIGPSGMSRATSAAPVSLR